MEASEAARLAVLGVRPRAASRIGPLSGIDVATAERPQLPRLELPTLQAVLPSSVTLPVSSRLVLAVVPRPRALLTLEGMRPRNPRIHVAHVVEELGPRMVLTALQTARLLQRSTAERLQDAQPRVGRPA